MLSNGKIMMETMVGSLKCRAIQIDSYGLDTTLHEVELFPNFGSIFSLLKSLEE
jgi:hypothetical protein